MKKKSKKKAGAPLTAIIIVAVLALWLAFPSLLPVPESVREAMRETERNHMLLQGDFNTTLAQILTAVLACCVVWLGYQLLKWLLSSIGKQGRRTLTITDLLISLLKYAAVIGAVVWCLSILGVNTGAVLAGVGFIGLIIGFGAQSLIEDIITGAFIIFENQYAVGDIIVLDDFRGVVRSIGVRTTVIEDTGFNLKVVNNSDIRNFQNRSKNKSLGISIVSVSYGTDLRRVEQIVRPAMAQMLEAHPDLYLSAPQYMGVEKLNDSGVDLKFTVDCKEVNIFAAQRMLNRDLKILFDENNIEIPFPQVVVHQGD